MMREDYLVETIDELTHDELARWLDEGLIRPQRRAGTRYYREIDVARVRLIVEMRQELRVHSDDIPFFISLIDQIHGLRHQLRRLAQAVEEQPESVRREIRRKLEPGQC